MPDKQVPGFWRVRNWLQLSQLLTYRANLDLLENSTCFTNAKMYFERIDLRLTSLIVSYDVLVPQDCICFNNHTKMNQERITVTSQSLLN